MIHPIENARKKKETFTYLGWTVTKGKEELEARYFDSKNETHYQVTGKTEDEIFQTIEIFMKDIDSKVA